MIDFTREPLRVVAFATAVIFALLGNLAIVKSITLGPGALGTSRKDGSGLARWPDGQHIAAGPAIPALLGLEGGARRA